MLTLSTTDKLKQLRDNMKEQGINAWLLMSADPHLSEYLPEHWKIRAWLSGFTGSVGTIIVTANFAGLWVDGRYWLQAEQQLAGSGISVQKLTADPQSTHLAWIKQHLQSGDTLAVNNQIISVQQFGLLEQISQQYNIQLYTQSDLIDELWLDRPALPVQTVHMMADGLNALTHLEKIEALREILATKQVASLFISSLDDIAWILNCRGCDVEYNPVFLAHLYIDQSRVVLFIAPNKLEPKLIQQLQHDGVEIIDYTQSAPFLSQLQQDSIWLDPTKVSAFHQEALPKSVKVHHELNPSTRLKASKHPLEIQHIRNAMLKDGIALCHFFTWLEQAISEKIELNELDIDKKLTAYRAQQLGYIGPSFATIAGFNANGAQPHYRATTEQFSPIHGHGLLLIDSGAQYHDGTTDITRVVEVGQATAQQKKDYTLVLKAHIALSQAVFPENLAAPLLDSIARQVLWQQGLDYRHGTGHGVGFALNVHEGPQVLSYYAPITADSALKAGMIVSNEPGLYHDGQYGIRIENLVTVQNKVVPTAHYGQFLHFENLTLCPIHQQCIVKELLNESEKQWLNNYHQSVYHSLAPYLTGSALEWLTHQTQMIQ
ncbi:aminopeptidase P family protein [Acinetobacter rudis]|uniref:Aminopeptidase P family protein n=1 Tax=Acinetobacter rudis TaxID=632955 RepID=A0AAW8J8T0_9GAMM|nr:aminopeptidase P family protein [Acinetobacter rudis]MDQ8935580.1 aminopeptidase P family protein [Acinetobacter rudis]MDQ9017843.1 aminopeptidase P family protein [Acinetobacter rudis]